MTDSKIIGYEIGITSVVAIIAVYGFFKYRKYMFTIDPEIRENLTTPSYNNVKQDNKIFNDNTEPDNSPNAQLERASEEEEKEIKQFFDNPSHLDPRSNKKFLEGDKLVGGRRRSRRRTRSRRNKRKYKNKTRK